LNYHVFRFEINEFHPETKVISQQFYEGLMEKAPNSYEKYQISTVVPSGSDGLIYQITPHNCLIFVSSTFRHT